MVISDVGDSAGATHPARSTQGGRLLHIGELATMVGLSIGTIRRYDELGIVVPSGRSPGGFRLYTDLDAQRFLFVKKLKPLGFSLEQVQEIISTFDELATRPPNDAVLARLEKYATMVAERREMLRQELRDAEVVSDLVGDSLAAARGTDAPVATPWSADRRS